MEGYCQQEVCLRLLVARDSDVAVVFNNTGSEVSVSQTQSQLWTQDKGKIIAAGVGGVATIAAAIIGVRCWVKKKQRSKGLDSKT